MAEKETCGCEVTTKIGGTNSEDAWESRSDDACRYSRLLELARGMEKPHTHQFDTCPPCVAIAAFRKEFVGCTNSANTVNE